MYGKNRGRRCGNVHCLLMTMHFDRATADYTASDACGWQAKDAVDVAGDTFRVTLMLLVACPSP